MCFVAPSRPADGARALWRHSSVGEERDQGEKAQQRRSGAPYCQLRPLPLRLESQPLTHLLKGGFHLPAPYEPRDDPLGIGAEIGAKERLSPELSFRITDQNSTQRHGRQARAVPQGGVRDHLHNTLLGAIPVGDYYGTPLRTRIFGHYGEGAVGFTAEESTTPSATSSRERSQTRSMNATTSPLRVASSGPRSWPTSSLACRKATSTTTMMSVHRYFL
jgi:hypothetical protein